MLIPQTSCQDKRAMGLHFGNTMGLVLIILLLTIIGCRKPSSDKSGNIVNGYGSEVFADGETRQGKFQSNIFANGTISYPDGTQKIIIEKV